MANAALLALLWTSMAPAGATPVWCFMRLEEDGRGGACAEPLGEERLPLADCCLNPAYGFRLRPQGLCGTCRPGLWGPWGPWGPCSVTCGEGTQRRGRRRGTPGGGSDGDGDGDSGDSDGDSDGDSREWQLRDCHRDCRPAPPLWSPWSSWSSCSASCKGAGPAPSRTRTRSCDWSTPAPRDPPGHPTCQGEEKETQECPSPPPCPVPGSWGPWAPIGRCSVTCGLGVMTYARACDAPAPQHGGPGCPGNSSRREICGPYGACPDSPRWGPWGPWSPCERRGWGGSIACQAAVGQQRRTRGCVGLSPPGPPCPPDPWGTIQLRACYNLQGCSLPGNWSDWSPWSLCTPPCGDHPTRTRGRHCHPRYPPYPLTITPVGSPSPTNVTFWGSPRVRCPPLGVGEGLEETRPCLNVTPCPSPHED